MSCRSTWKKPERSPFLWLACVIKIQISHKAVAMPVLYIDEKMLAHSKRLKFHNPAESKTPSPCEAYDLVSFTPPFQAQDMDLKAIH